MSKCPVADSACNGKIISFHQEAVKINKNFYISIPKQYSNYFCKLVDVLEGSMDGCK